MNMTIFEEFDKIFGDMPRRFFRGRPGSFWYGYEVIVGPDGQPRMHELGDAPAPGTRQIFVDTIFNEKTGELKLVAEIPGVEKSDIHVDLNGDILSISAARDNTKYQTQVPLHHPVDHQDIRASYRNGILEIVCKMENKPRGKSVRVN